MTISNGDQKMLEEINEAYARLKADKEGWEEEIKERQEIEGTIGDGLEIVPECEFWLYKNKKALASVQRGIKEAREGKLEKNAIDLDQFE
jgi:hypothetical protein